MEPTYNVYLRTSPTHTIVTRRMPGRYHDFRGPIVPGAGLYR